VADLAVDDLTEQAPAFAIEFHQLHLFDREKSLAPVLILIPGNSTSPEKFFRFAACFITAIRHDIADLISVSLAPWILSFLRVRRGRGDGRGCGKCRKQ
jgi:hypothetical protein